MFHRSIDVEKYCMDTIHNLVINFQTYMHDDVPALARTYAIEAINTLIDLQSRLTISKKRNFRNIDKELEKVRAECLERLGDIAIYLSERDEDKWKSDERAADIIENFNIIYRGSKSRKKKLRVKKSKEKFIWEYYDATGHELRGRVNYIGRKEVFDKWDEIIENEFNRLEGRLKP